tara:strand:- start:95 stop:385 length:291 start_codon:yes stop_codon:yes gene_type:complete
MARKKWKRKSGHVSEELVISKKQMVEYDLFLDTFYDDWEDWRDGSRDWFRDFKTIKKINLRRYDYLDENILNKRLSMNQKQKRLLKRRKSRKSFLH